MAQIRSDEWHEVTRLAVSGSHGDFKLGVQRLSHRIEAGVAYNALVRPQVDGRRSVRIAMERASMRIEDPAGFISDLMWEQRDMYAALRASYREAHDRAVAMVAEAEYLRAQCSDMRKDCRRLRDERNRATAQLEEATARVAELEAQLGAVAAQQDVAMEEGLVLDADLFSDEASGSGSGGEEDDSVANQAFLAEDDSAAEDEAGEGPQLEDPVDQQAVVVAADATVAEVQLDVSLGHESSEAVEAVVAETTEEAVTATMETEDMVVDAFAGVWGMAVERVVAVWQYEAVAAVVAAAVADVNVDAAGDGVDGEAQPVDLVQAQSVVAEVQYRVRVDLEADAAAVDYVVNQVPVAAVALVVAVPAASGAEEEGPVDGDVVDGGAEGGASQSDAAEVEDGVAADNESDGEANQAFLEEPALVLDADIFSDEASSSGDEGNAANQEEYGPVLQGLEVDVFDPPPPAGKRKRKLVMGNRLIDHISPEKARRFQRYY